MDGNSKSFQTFLIVFAIKKGKNEKKNAFTFLKTLSNLERCEINSLAGQMDEDDISVLREAPDTYLMSLFVLLRSTLEKRRSCISCFFFLILSCEIQNNAIHI